MGKVDANLPSIVSRTSGEPIEIEPITEGTRKFCPSCLRWFPLTANHFYFSRRKEPKRDCEITGEWGGYCKACQRSLRINRYISTKR